MQLQKSTSLITKEPFFPIRVSSVLKPDTKTMAESATVFVCPEPGCTKTFARFSDFELHLDVGEPCHKTNWPICNIIYMIN